MRVVSLTCSNTEIVAALGCASMLVGVDDHSDHPAEVVASLPRVGLDLGIDIARVSALRPDLVLASLTVPGHEKVVERIAAAGLRYLAPSPVSLADVYADVAEIAALLGVRERGERLIAEMRGEIRQPRAAGSAAGATVADAAAVADSIADRPRVVVEWWPKPVIVPGKLSWVNDLLQAAGGVNPFATRPSHSLAVSDDEMIAAAPDAVVVSWCGVELSNYRLERVYQRNSWSGVPALQNRRVHAVSEAFLGRPGPRLVEGYRKLAAIVDECRAKR